MLSREFALLLQEGHLTRSSLMSGFGFLNRADYQEKKGSFYSAFFQLSIGVERIVKIAYILNFKLENNMKLPTDKELRSLGHKLKESYDCCAGFDVSPPRFSKIGSLEYEVLSVLSEFADGARYYNLNELSGGRKLSDPLQAWREVHSRVAEQELSYRKREALARQVLAHCERYKIFHYSEIAEGHWVPHVDVMLKEHILAAAKPYCVWLIISLLEPFYELLYRLCAAIHKLQDGSSVPEMYEFFPFLLCDKNTVIRRRSWVALYD